MHIRIENIDRAAILFGVLLAGAAFGALLGREIFGTPGWGAIVGVIVIFFSTPLKVVERVLPWQLR